MRRPSFDSVMSRWWIVTVSIIGFNVAIVVYNAYVGNWWITVLPIACIIVLTFQQGFYMGRRRGYDRLMEEIKGETWASCIGGPMDGHTIPKPPATTTGHATVEGFPEGRYELHDGVMLWVEE